MMNSKSEAATKLILFLFRLSALWAHSKNWKIHYYVRRNKRPRPVSSRTQDPNSASQTTCSAQKFECEARTQTVGISLEFFPMEMLVASGGGSLSNGPGSSDDGIQVKLFLRCDWVILPELWGLPGGTVHLPMQETDLIPGSGRCPGEGNGNLLPRPLVFLDPAHFQAWFFTDPMSSLITFH